MKKNILVLCSALVVFLLTLFVCNNSVVNSAIKEADHINALYLEQVRQQMDISLLVCEKTMEGFLTGICYFHITDDEEHPDTTLYIKDKELLDFEKNVYDYLCDFVNVNIEIYSALFIVEPSVFPTLHPNGFVPLVNHNGTEMKDISSSYLFDKSKNYQRLKTTGKDFWCLPSLTSPMRGKTIIYYWPVYRENGDFLGACSINVSFETLRKRLKKSLPYGDENSAVIVVDEDNNIILSTDKDYEEYITMDDFMKELNNDKRYSELESDSEQHKTVNWNGKRYFVYSNNLRRTPWRTITICSEEAIYETVSKSQTVVLVASLVGVLMMLFCCLFIFSRIRTTMKQRAAVESELNLAADVQRKLLKAPQLTIGNARLQAMLKPAKAAGGDLYDYIVKDGHLIFCIGDVSGKGMAAALFMAQVCSLFRTAVRASSDPKQIMTEINNVASADNPTMTFCTLFIGCLDMKTGEVVFCNAGHDKPYVNRQLLPVRPNLAIGLMEGYPYQSETMVLVPGDVLMLYTDGVTEAKDKRRDMFREEGIVQLFADGDMPSPAECVDRLYAAVHAFEDGTEQSDDITIMAISCG